MRKKFTMGAGKYYFNVYSGNVPILIYRDNKEAAIRRYLSYKKNGKTCEWLGLWNGKKFEEASLPSDAKQ